MPLCKKDCESEGKVCNDKTGRCNKPKKAAPKKGDIKGAIIHLMSLKDIMKCTSKQCAFWIMFKFETATEKAAFHIRKSGNDTFVIAIMSEDIETRKILQNELLIYESTLPAFIEKLQKSNVDKLLKTVWNKVLPSQRRLEVNVYPKYTSAIKNVTEAANKILECLES